MGQIHLATGHVDETPGQINQTSGQIHLADGLIDETADLIDETGGLVYLTKRGVDEINPRDDVIRGWDDEIFSGVNVIQ